MEAAALDALIEKFDGPGVSALVLAGSHARGDAGPYSDVDLLRFAGGAGGRRRRRKVGSHLVGGRLVVVSDVGAAAVEKWFSAPEEACDVVAGLRAARPLIDRGAGFARIRERALSFVWDAPMQRKADAWASREMAGWAEEVHKGLEGLRRGDVGRMLHARHGCTWGLSRVVQVQRGVLLSGDNGFYDEVAEAVGRESEWVRLRRVAFGVTSGGEPAPALHEQVAAGLRLYALTADMLARAIRPEDAPPVAAAAGLVRRELGPTPGAP